MERSTANISYKGSVTDAIFETQRQKKLFVVYISGDDADSTLLEQSVWADNRVAVSISKYCIFLHLVQGSVDAIQFSVIYPQKSVPSITAVGYNGIKLWQHEGYASVENFVASIENAWASLHLQETTLTLLTQALASKKPETLDVNSQIGGENSSTSNTGSSSAAKVIDNLEDKPTQEPKLLEQEMISETEENNDEMHGLHTSLQSNTAVKVREDPKIPQSSKRENVGSMSTDMHSSLASRDIDISVVPEETKEKPSEINTVVKDEKTKNEEVSEPVDCSNVVKSNDINLNIRMPDGGSLKRKFMMTDTLRSVKQYINENQGSGISSYDLAIPYPRKVFTEQDMDVILSELGFAARQALIAVPHGQANIPPLTSNPQHSTTSMVVSTDGNSGGYFGLLKRALSFVNPFSYLGGNTNSSNFESAPHTPRAQSNSYQYQPYRPNDALQGRLLSGTASSSRPSVQTQTDHSSANQSTGEIRRRTARPFGSNIHTLKHDEDDLQSRDSNTFWNGNSTQYGGDDKK